MPRACRLSSCSKVHTNKTCKPGDSASQSTARRSTRRSTRHVSLSGSTAVCALSRSTNREPRAAFKGSRPSLTCQSQILRTARPPWRGGMCARLMLPSVGVPVRRSALSVELRQVRTSFGKMYPIIRCGIERVSSVGLLFRRPFRKIRLLSMAAIRPAFGNK